VGVATLTEAIGPPDRLVVVADRALDHPKRTGRNRVTHQDDIAEG
jgi:PleD family two-component response regulator